MKERTIKKPLSKGLASLLQENEVEVLPIQKEDGQLTDQNAILQSRIEKVRHVVGTLKVDFVLLGGYLVDLKPYVHDIWSDRKMRYCKDIYELAQQEFNLCKTTVKNVIGVATRFGECFTRVKEEFKEYNYSQLVEMLPLSDEQLALVAPGMTQQEIRALKKLKTTTGQLTDQISNNPPLNPLDCQFELTNDKQRIEFVRDYYKFWGLWLDIPELELKVYKAELNNGDLVVVSEFPPLRRPAETTYMRTTFCLVKKGTSPDFYGFDFYGIPVNDYLSYMRGFKPKVICPFKCKDFNEYKQIVERGELNV